MATRNRTARAAVLGSSVQRSATPRSTSRTSPALRRRVVLATLVAVSLGLITLYFRGSESGGLHSFQSAGASALRPFQVAAERVVQPFRDVYDYFDGLIHAKSENERLRKENQELRQTAIQYRNAYEESEALKRLLGYRASPTFPADYQSIATDVIGHPPSQFEQRVVVAAGSRDGVRLDDPVVNGEGLVGRVTETTATTAEVTLVTDQSSAVSALDVDNNVHGLVRHGKTGRRDYLVMDLVEKSYVVEQGDQIVTAGSQRGQLPSLYPRGIPIGIVSFVGQSDTDLYKRIQLRPAVDFGALDSVLVLVPRNDDRG